MPYPYLASTFTYILIFNIISKILDINTGSMRQGDHFLQTKKKSEKPVIDIIDFK